jgi:hypothetical protein
VSNLLSEVGLRLLKAGVALIVGGLIYVVAIGPLGTAPSVELALLSWVSAAAFVLLVESSPL